MHKYTQLVHIDFVFLLATNLAASIGKHPISWATDMSPMAAKGKKKTVRMTGTMFVRDTKETIRLAAS